MERQTKEEIEKQISIFASELVPENTYFMFNSDDIKIHTIHCYEKIENGFKDTSKDYLWIRKKK